ncbi:hypothetical protein [Hydrogenophaga sp. PAMC20947]|uniref:hypothetical protein n=1 Tax=Hydrogenophaga sp. PAMC20947 TaxID=2565558 RepID=UPI0014467702|nr:hypothetical protein [Hydrogenophaga sp. PAMC20947]
MALLFLEALGALVLLLFIVWWTMFSGRKNGELPSDVADELPDGAPKAGEKVDKGNKGEKGEDKDEEAGGPKR